MMNDPDYRHLAPGWVHEKIRLEAIKAIRRPVGGVWAKSEQLARMIVEATTPFNAERFRAWSHQTMARIEREMAERKRADGR